MPTLRLAVVVLLAASVGAEARAQPFVWIRAVGDVMLGTDFPDSTYLPPDDGRGLLDDVAPWLREADLTFANLEGPFLDGGETDKCGTREGHRCYAFRTPTRYGGYLVEAGIDLASTANNHAQDFEEEGRVSTEHLLDSLGIAWSGRPGTSATLDRKGLRIGMVAFHTSRTGNYLNDPAEVAGLVQRAARTHDVVIVSFHGGAEGRDALHVPDGREFYYREDRGDLRRFARQAIDAGADLVLGHGPHVPRGLELYRDRLVAYSLGNFATYGRFSLGGPLGVGFVLETVLDDEGRFVRGRILPTRQVGEGIPRRDPSGEAIRLVRELSEADFPTTRPEISRDGWIVPPRWRRPPGPRVLTPRPPRQAPLPEAALRSPALPAGLSYEAGAAATGRR